MQFSNCVGLLTWIFFNKYTVGPPYPQVLHMKSQLTVVQNSIFYLWLGIRICRGLIYTWIFDCAGVGTPKPCFVQGSAVLKASIS